jgi:hypothetical protein
VNRLDVNTLKEIATLICGTDGNGPVYRQYWEIERFFANAGWADVPQFEGGRGYGRDRWTCDLLLERRDDPESIAQVIRRLAHPREYPKEPSLAFAARDALNEMLAIEGLRIEYTSGRPELIEVEPSISPPEPKAPAELHGYIGEIVQTPGLGELLQQRLNEAETCQRSGAHLSAVIMLGSVLEGVLVDIARSNMAQACRTVPPPRNREGQLPVEEWKLSHLIDVAHKCGWIDLDVKRFGHELREYRNMVHAAGELKDGHHPDGYTVTICWDVVVGALNDLSRVPSPATPAA